MDNVQIQERKNSSYPGTKTFDIRRPHVSMFLSVEMKHPSTSINAMGVKATNYGAMKRYELFRLRTAANSLISRQFSCRFVLLSVIKAKSTITQMLQVILFEIDCPIFYTNLHELFCQFIT